MTARATSTGWRAVVSPQAAPVEPSPSMTQLSISARPSSVSAAPRPALKHGSSSITRTAATTASSALAPSERSA